MESSIETENTKTNINTNSKEYVYKFVQLGWGGGTVEKIEVNIDKNNIDKNNINKNNINKNNKIEN